MRGRQVETQESLLRAELEQLYCLHRQALFSLALTVTGCPGLAEDAVHEAFVRLCQIDKPPDGPLTPYVFAAVRNAAIDCRRRQVHQRALAESVFENAVESTSGVRDSDESIEQLIRLRRLIDVLEESSREIVVMKAFGDLTFDEIGLVLGLPGATIATRYRRALLKLEEQLRRAP